MINYKSRNYGKTKEISISELKKIFANQKLSYLDVVVLFGSRANGTATKQSDYDFAIYGDSKDMPFGLQAKAWIDISMSMDISEYDIDVVDLKYADTLIKESIKSGYIVLKGDDNDISRLLD